MAASVTSLQLFMSCAIVENTGGGPPGIPVLSTFRDFDQSLNLNSGTSPAPALFAVYKQSLGSTLSPDFTSAQGSNGNVNATGKRLLGMLVTNPATATADVNIATGATNGYALPQPVKVKPGGFVVQWFGGALGVIDATHKTLDITGDGTTTPEIGLIFG